MKKDIKQIMKIGIEILVLFASLLTTHGAKEQQCPWSSKATCYQRVTMDTCISKTVLSSLTPSRAKKCTAACSTYKIDAIQECNKNCPTNDCMTCMDEVERVVDNCTQFYNELNDKKHKCGILKSKLVDCCRDVGCQVCRDIFCQNGGVCKGGPNYLSCKCPAGFTGVYCQRSQCSRKCQNGGQCVGPNNCKCSAGYKGRYCQLRRLGTKLNPSPNAQAILDAGDSVGSGLYWIQPPGESSPAQTYCDMTYSDGGWMLASYGYVASVSSSSANKAIPNMNNPMGYLWRPDKRASRNGVINLLHGAVMMARNARYMIMAGGNNPNTDIDQYTHVYRIDLRQNIHNITFANHNNLHGASGSNGIPKMHVVDFLVVGLKGDVGEYERFALGESLGVTWPDTYPTGYGFNDKGLHADSFGKGPFFPSIHSGDGRAKCLNGLSCRTYEPDVTMGTESYVHKGWYTATGVNQVGQTSIWFK